MQFQDFLDPNSVCIESEAQSKTATLLKISQLLSQNHTELNLDTLFQAFWKRDSLGSTAIGHGVIIPHIRSATISKTCGCLLRLHNPVDFGAEDKKPIDLVLGLVVPQEQTEQHLQTLTEIIKKFSNSEFRHACRKANDNKALYYVLIQEWADTWHEQIHSANVTSALPFASGNVI